MPDLSQIIGDSVALLEAGRLALLQETITARTSISDAIEGLSKFERGIASLTAEQGRQVKQAERAKAKAAADAAQKEAERQAEIERKHTAVAAAKAQREQEESDAEAFLKSKAKGVAKK